MASHASESSIRPAPQSLTGGRPETGQEIGAEAQQENEGPPLLTAFPSYQELEDAVRLHTTTLAEETLLHGGNSPWKTDSSAPDPTVRVGRLPSAFADRQPAATRAPSRLTSAEVNTDNAEGEEAEAAGTDTQHARAPKREKFAHEQDHDSCPFLTIRQSEWFIKFLDRIHRTSPMDLDKILASFSIKNYFMFYPPPKTYRFLFDKDGNVSVGESAIMADTEDVEARLRREQQHLLLRKRSKRGRVDYEAPPQLDPRKQFGATHGISGLGIYMTPSGKSPRFEMVFIPWKNEIQSYRIVKDEVILEKKITIGGPLFSFSLGCPIPCSIIRPNCRMSSHVALFFHCNGEDIGHSSCIRLQTLANALHVTVLVPEYPGYGLFRGSTSEATVKGAMERVVQFMLSVDGSLTPSRLLLIGHSIGGAVAVHIATYIQEVFERMQAHYEHDVACPAAYTNELAHQGKPTFFEAFQPRQQAKGVAGGGDGAKAKETPCSHEPFGKQTDEEEAVVPMDEVRPARHRVVAEREDADSQRGPPRLDSDAIPDHRETHRSTSLRESGNRREEADANDADRKKEDGGEMSSGSANIFSQKCDTDREKATRTSAFCLPCGREGTESDEEDEQVRRMGWCTCGGGIGRRLKVKKSSVTHCRHNAVGGIILISSFTALRCIEYVPTFKNTYKLHTTQLEVRRRQVPRDEVCPAPLDWRQDASKRVPPEDIPFSYEEMTTPLVFKMSRFLSFNRFPTVDAMCRLQETYHYFNHTPLLLIHGTDDELIPPIHSVALASKLRQCTNGGATARVFLSFITNGGHNELPCIREIRRFYKDQILKPHLQHQEHFRKKLVELYHAGRDRMDGSPLEKASQHPHQPHLPSHSQRGGGSFKAESRTETPLPPPTELYFLSRDPNHSVRGEERSAPASPLSLSRHVQGSHLHQPPSHPHHPHTHHHSVHHLVGADDHEDDNRTSGLVTRESSLTFPHGDLAALRSRSNSAHVARERDVHGPFIHREPTTLSQPDDPGSAVKNSSLLHTLAQTQTAQHPDEAAFAPAATMLHMSMFPSLDKYDVGSVLVAAVRANALAKGTANELYARHHRLAWGWRIFVSALCLVAAMVMISVGITHAVLCRPEKLRSVMPAGRVAAEYKRDDRILAWSVLEAIFLGIAALLHLLSPMHGLSNVSKERERHHHATFRAYAVLNIVALALLLGFGILMGFILAFTPHERGGVHWQKWSDLPYERKVWISYLPRWLMVAVACWHSTVLVFFVVKNH